MRCATVMLLLASLFAAVGAAFPQEQHLGEVAETIHLSRPDGEPVVIDDQSLPPAVPLAEETPYPQRLATLAEAYRSAVQELETALGALDRGNALYDPAWKESVEAICSKIDEIGLEVAAAAPSSPYTAAHEALLAAAREYSAAADAVRRANANMTPTIGERIDHLRDGRLWLEQAQTLAGEARARLELERTPEDVVNGQGFDAGASACASSYPTDLDLQRQCLRVQERAIRELEARTAFGAGLDAAAFNRIRNSCQEQWGKDYTARNDCEQKALAIPPQG